MLKPLTTLVPYAILGLVILATIPIWVPFLLLAFTGVIAREGVKEFFKRKS